MAASFPEIGKTIDRHQFHGLLEQPTQEKKLGDLRRNYATSGSAVDNAAVLVTEGGGARMFREGRKLKGGRLERMIASATEVVYQDEKRHYKEAAREAVPAVQNKQDLARMKRRCRK